MWLHLLYLVSTLEAAALAAVLFWVVIEPEWSLPAGTRQICAAAALVLAVGCCYAGYAWLSSSLPKRGRLNL